MSKYLTKCGECILENKKTICCADCNDYERIETEGQSNVYDENFGWYVS